MEQNLGLLFSDVTGTVYFIQAATNAVYANPIREPKKFSP